MFQNPSKSATPLAFSRKQQGHCGTLPIMVLSCKIVHGRTFRLGRNVRAARAYVSSRQKRTPAYVSPGAKRTPACVSPGEKRTPPGARRTRRRTLSLERSVYAVWGETYAGAQVWLGRAFLLRRNVPPGRGDVGLTLECAFLLRRDVRFFPEET